jgi:hypothetical protein
MAIAAVRAHLTTITAKLDRVELDGMLPPDADRPASRARIDPTAIYARWNQPVSPNGKHGGGG